jgi:predicted outer membrane repeat protein
LLRKDKNMKTKNLLIFSLVLGLGLAAGVVLVLNPVPTARAAGPWYVSPSGDDSDCLSWATACTTIDGALSKASSGDTINVGAGTYMENVYITKDITLLGASAGSTIVDGGNAGPTLRVYQYMSATISGMTLRNGTDGTGGGLRADRNTTVRVIDTTIFDNRAPGHGGGMYLAMYSVVTITNSTIISNSASLDGGGIYGDAPNGTLTIVDSTVSDNVAANNGGGIYQNSGTLAIEGSDIVSNTAQSNGGGVAKTGGTMRIERALIGGNTAVDHGGGVYGSSTTVTIDDSTVRDNQISGASSSGGGIFNDAQMTLTDVTVAGNTSIQYGGGIHSQDPMTLTNVTVSGNTAGNGGGILHTGGSTMALLNCTIADNTIGTGSGPGGLRAYSPVSMRNTIIANNEGANCGIGGGGSLTSLGYNLESADSCGLNATGDITSTNPLLGPLQNNGGTTVGLGEPTLTHALLANSPAVDAGDPAFAPPPAYDQRGIGFPRVLYGRVDIGAYEAAVYPPVAYLPLVIKD